MRKTPLTLAHELYVLLMQASPGEHKGIIRSFLASLALTRRSSFIPRIVEAFSRIAFAAEGKSRGNIVSAQALPETVVARITQEFPNTVFEKRVDRSLKGGIIIQVEDEVRDHSVRGILTALHKSLVG